MTVVTRYFGGVDPGGTGALAIVNQSGQMVAVEAMPMQDKRVTAALLRPWTEIDVELWGIEHVASMPKQGLQSMFNFGARWGVVHGALGARHRAVIDVRPATWKKTFRIGGDQKAQKAKARRLASEYWPTFADVFVAAGGEGKAEAALIAKHVQMMKMGIEA